MNTYLGSERLFLRKWHKQDIEPLAKINASPLVMEFFPKALTFDQTIDFIEKINNHFDTYGFGFYALELKETSALIGFCGLQEITVPIPYLANQSSPIFEIKWRISHSHWGKGYAPEAAECVLNSAFHKHKLPKVMAFTSKSNTKSIRVMEKIGMHYIENQDFHLPVEAEDLQLHVLYEIVNPV